MDLEEVKKCLRALLSSSSFSYHLNSLLIDFKESTGFNLPLFGHRSAKEFLSSLKDLVVLSDDSYNPEILLIESKKSSHIISLVDRQRSKSKNPMEKQKRQVVPLNKVWTSGSSRKTNSTNSCWNSSVPSGPENGETKSATSPPRNYHMIYTPFKIKVQHISNTPKSNFIARPPVGPSSPKHLTKKDNILQPKHQNLSDSKSTTVLSNETQIKMAEFKYFEINKTDSYFEDISDSENCLSKSRSKSPVDRIMFDSSDSVNSGIKDKLKKLIKNHPNGLWCCDLPELFFQEYHFMLDYQEFGYTSLIQMLSELPDVFRCLRPGNEDWIVFDASVPPSPEEKKVMVLQTRGNVLVEVKAKIENLLKKYSDSSSAAGVEVNKIPELYEETFGTPLDLDLLGFKDVKSLLETWEGSVFSFLKARGKLFCRLGLCKPTQSGLQWEEALPPITADSDIFAEIFPEDVVGPEETLHELDLRRHIATGHIVEVCVAEVWSPYKFFLQLKKFRNRLNRFMDELQKFYSLHLNKYKMPDSTIRPNQVCVGLYNSDPEFPDEWHRAKIIKVNNEKTVLLNFVDYGTVTRLKKSQLRFLHRSFQSFPIQAFEAELAGVIPPNEENTWPMTTNKKFLEQLRVPHLTAEIIDIDFQKPFLSVILTDPFEKSKISINKRLVFNRLAKMKATNDSKVKLSKLKGETVDSNEENGMTSGSESTELTEKSSNVESEVEFSLNSSVPEISDQFLDIEDLNQSALCQSEMGSSTRRPALPVTEIKKNSKENGILYEFVETSDLNKSYEEVQTKTKGHCQQAISNIEEVLARLPLSSTPSIAEEKKPKFSLPTPVKETSFSNLVETRDPAETFLNKPKRLPPGLENINPCSSLTNTPFVLQNLKKKINVLAMELLATNESIKEVGANDPALALKIATEMAEVYTTSQLSLNPLMCYNFYSPFPQNITNFGLHNDTLKEKLETGAELLLPPETTPPQVTESVPSQAVEPDPSPLQVIEPLLSQVIEAIPSQVIEPVPSQDSPKVETGCQNDSNHPISSEEEPVLDSQVKFKLSKNYIEQTQVAGKTLHLIKLDGELFICVEELIRQFTTFNCREVVDRVLLTRKIKVDYRIISKQEDSQVFAALKSTDGLDVAKKKKSKKLKFYLLQFSKVVQFLGTLGCQTKELESDFEKKLSCWKKGN